MHLAAKTDDIATELSWRCHPSRRSVMRTTMVLAFLLALLMFISWYTGSLGLAVLFTVVMFLSLSAYFFPTWYTLSETGISVRTLVTNMKRPWSVYRSHWPDRNGVLLSPFPARSRLENFRGIFVRYEDNRDEVLAYVKKFVPEPEGED